jgi:predicted regulator of Ras-like GTPase activity (Roadblock/LC7/MglB family)
LRVAALNGERGEPMTATDTLDAALLQLRLDCPDLLGALVATQEGLLLASCGDPSGETAAAMASHLADSLDALLALLAQAGCTESLLWTERGLWGVARLATRHVVMVHATGECRAANLRLALGRLRRDLAGTLTGLAGQEVGD